MKAMKFDKSLSGKVSCKLLASLTLNYPSTAKKAQYFLSTWRVLVNIKGNISFNSFHNNNRLGTGLPIQVCQVLNHWVDARWTQSFILLKLICGVPEISGNLLVRSKLPSHIGSAALKVEPDPQKRAQSFFKI